MPLQAKIPSPPSADLTYTLFSPSGLTKDKQTEVRRRMLPAEWYPQSGVQLTWPHAGTDWAYILDEVTECYIRLTYEIAKRQTLLIVTPHPEDVERLLKKRLPAHITKQIRYAACPTDDTWARDHAFLTVLTPDGPELTDFRFNGWGGKFEASQDNAINRRLYEQSIVNGRYTDQTDFVLEGGSIESDGNGTLLTTSECLLTDTRNPHYTRAEIEERLCSTFGAERILWLDHGYLAGDDTDSHIDTLARLCPGGGIAYVQCTDKTDEHYQELRMMEEQLRTFRQADGSPYVFFPLPMPEAIYADTESGKLMTYTEAQAAKAEGKDIERLPATYANFLILNHAVLYPTYGQSENDEKARRVLERAFPKYDITGIDCRALIKQHGSLHCVTMQYPIGVF